MHFSACKHTLQRKAKDGLPRPKGHVPKLTANLCPSNCSSCIFRHVLLQVWPKLGECLLPQVEIDSFGTLRVRREYFLQRWFQRHCGVSSVTENAAVKCGVGCIEGKDI